MKMLRCLTWLPQEKPQLIPADCPACRKPRTRRLHTYYVIAGNVPVLVHNCDIPWSSSRVADASKALDRGDTSIYVGSRSEAEKLFLRRFQGDGYVNTTDSFKWLKSDYWKDFWGGTKE